MENYTKIIKTIVRDIEVLANIIADDKNMEKYIREFYNNFNDVINEALDEGDYRYAALIAVQEELFNRI